MTVATALGTGALALGVLAGCGTDEKPSPPLTEPTSAATPSDSPSESAATCSPTTADDLVGDWADTEVDWTVHFKDGGKFTMDYEGVTDFMSGTYTLQDGKVSLEGGDGFSSVPHPASRPRASAPVLSAVATVIRRFMRLPRSWS
ncbi:MAG: hypothetical protein EON52_13720 [Actinomycetales bacterium]|nr:MAG: hypothetical protein EON52_13720 [Actinomycetales bacterium]